MYVVSHDPGNSFKVKLGEPGIPDFKAPNQIYWMPLQMLQQFPTDLTWEKCNIKSDVWAFATTLWQIFCYGDAPLLTPFRNFDGSTGKFLLPQPPILRETLAQVYIDVMLRCWQPDLSQQKAPQSIMKDMNQVLYRVFNSKHINAYISIDSGDDYSYQDTVTQVSSVNTTCTTLEQDQVSPQPPKNLMNVGVAAGSAGGQWMASPKFSDFSQGGNVIITNGSGDR